MQFHARRRIDLISHHEVVPAINQVEENFNVFDFELGLDEMNVISALDTKQSCFFSH